MKEKEEKKSCAEEARQFVRDARSFSALLMVSVVLILAYTDYSLLDIAKELFRRGSKSDEKDG